MMPDPWAFFTIERAIGLATIIGVTMAYVMGGRQKKADAAAKPASEEGHRDAKIEEAVRRSADFLESLNSRHREQLEQELITVGILRETLGVMREMLEHQRKIEQATIAHWKLAIQDKAVQL